MFPSCSTNHIILNKSNSTSCLSVGRSSTTTAAAAAAGGAAAADDSTSTITTTTTTLYSACHSAPPQSGTHAFKCIQTYIRPIRPFTHCGALRINMIDRVG
eukprot:GHVU01055948.1.p2 GENE.GHVU01055948.1~~GHVU01055948.1.p2  ORF type:complete len:101 (-),score=12.20 GHVU01055948.1:261-563(-)